MGKKDPRYEGNEDVRMFRSNRKDSSAAGDSSWYELENIGYISGGQSSTDEVITAQPDTKFLNFYCESSATTGDARGLYMRLHFSGATSGGGEAARFWAYVSAACTAGTINGIHATVEFPSGGSEAGSANAGRFTLTAAGTKTLTGTYSVLSLDSSLATGITVSGQKVSFIRMTELDSVAIPFWLNFDFAAGAAKAVRALTAGANGAMTIPILVNGATWYIALSASAS